MIFDCWKFSLLYLKKKLDKLSDKEMFCIVKNNLKVRAYRHKNFLTFVYTLHPETAVPTSKRLRDKDGRLAPVYLITTYWSDKEIDTSVYWMFDELNYIPDGRKIKLEDVKFSRKTLRALIIDVLHHISLEYDNEILCPEFIRIAEKLITCR